MNGEENHSRKRNPFFKRFFDDAADCFFISDEPKIHINEISALVFFHIEFDLEVKSFAVAQNSHIESIVTRARKTRCDIGGGINPHSVNRLDNIALFQGCRADRLIVKLCNFGCADEASA